MGCTRPVCFFAHSEGQLRHTGVPGGPQPVVAPPEPIVAPGPGALGHHRHMEIPHDQMLLSSISEAAVNMHRLLDAAGGSGGFGGQLGGDQRAISDVLPSIGGGVPPPARGRRASANVTFMAQAQPIQSMPLPLMEWRHAASDPGVDAALHQQLGFGHQGMDDLAALKCDAAALAHAQLQHVQHAQQQAAQQAQMGLDRRSGDLRRSISEAAALAPAAAPPGVNRQLSGPIPAEWQQAPAGAAVLEQLQRQLLAMQMASGPLDTAALAAAMAPPSASAPLPGFHGYAGAPLMGQGSDVAAIAAALMHQQQLPPLGTVQEAGDAPDARGSSRDGLLEAGDARVEAPCRGSGAPLAWSAPASPGRGSSDGGASAASAPLPVAFSRAPGSSREASRDGSPSAAEGAGTGAALMVVGNESLDAEGLQAHLLGQSAQWPAAATAADAAADAGGMGREAAAQLLAEMPEDAVRDLLRALSAGQAALAHGMSL
jgi:hypothetical protein